MQLGNMREDYQQGELLESEVSSNPFKQFENWFQTALTSDLTEPNAMLIATVNGDGSPSMRTVLMKDFSEAGFVFYTNFNSRKGKDIEANPQVALLFYWGTLERQIRIEGRAERVPSEIADGYFHSRPRSSQIGAHASPQSQVIPDRDFLQDQLRDLEAQFADHEIPRPEHWGGYCIKPVYFEFWQGRSSRLHDRICYRQIQTKGKPSHWQVERLAP